MSTTPDLIRPLDPHDLLEPPPAAPPAPPASTTAPPPRSRADVETELEEVKAQIAEADERLKTLAGDDRFAALDEREVLVERLQELAAQLPSEEPAEPAPDDDNVVSLFGSQYVGQGRRAILVTPAIHKMVEEATEAVAEDNMPPRIFQRAGRLAHFVIDPLSGDQKLTDLGWATFTVELSRMASFYRKETGKDSKPTLVPVPPPRVVVQALMEAPPRSAPALKRISWCPYLRAGSGWVVRERGYQDIERIYMADDFTKAISVPETPTEAEVKAARDLICDELLGDFPFAHPSDRAHAVAMLLEPFVAEVINGPNPLHLIEASVIDSGKTQLGDVGSVLARGQRNSWLNFAGEKEEQTKMLAAALLDLPSVVAIDNVKVTLDLPLLELALTGSAKVRILGKSEMSPTLNTQGITFMATVNNATLSDDLLRRSVRSRLEPGTERPGDRVFRHPDLIGWVLENRMQLVTALLTLAKNWMRRLQQGAPAWAGRRLSSFKRWSEVMGGILEAAGIEGFLDDRTIREEMKSDATTEWHALIAAWEQRFQHRHVTAREVLDELVAPPVPRYTKDGTSYTVPAEAVTLLPDSMGATKIEARAKKLGQLLRSRRGNIFDGWKIRNAHDDSTNQNVYWLERMSATPVPQAQLTEHADFTAAA
jgi:hypothetical protein